MLSKFILNVSMNKEQSWTLEPWHVRAAFRRAHVIVPDSAITMPEYPITGPDMNLEGKEFFVTLTVAKSYTVCV
jgi:large subunit ribosomal protein L9